MPLLRVPSENQRRVYAAEREIVIHDIVALQVTPIAGDVVEISAFRIDFGEVYCRRVPVTLKHFDGHPGFERTARAQRMTDIALE